MLLQPLPPTSNTAPHTVLACGAWLKNAACLLQGDRVRWTPLHGDLGDPANCLSLESSVEELVALADGTIEAVAHDLHPDFFSTRVALEVADRLGVPAIAVQHHHAHIGVVMAEHGLQEPVIGLALDGVGLGTDGVAWGGELLWVEGAAWRRLGHLQTLTLPGGDTAAREPWRMAATVLHALQRGDEISQRFSGVVGQAAAQTVQAMLERGTNCLPTTSAGRWFDAAAGALGICVKQKFEAEAAIALEKMAEGYLLAHRELESTGDFRMATDGTLELLPLLSSLLVLADSDDAQSIARGAAIFHLTLVQALAEWAEQAARSHGVRIIALGGGCFFNHIVRLRLDTELTRRGLRVLLPQTASCGDSGLALGQAWVARQQLAVDHARAA